MSKKNSDKLFCEIALAQDFVSEEQVEAALDAQRVDEVVGRLPKTIDRYLVELNALTDHHAYAILQKMENNQFSTEDANGSVELLPTGRQHEQDWSRVSVRLNNSARAAPQNRPRDAQRVENSSFSEGKRELSTEINGEDKSSENELESNFRREKNLPEPKPISNGNSIILPCPYCGKDSSQFYNKGISNYSFICKLCNRHYNTLLGYVRSKKSRIISREKSFDGIRKIPSVRDFEVRLILLDDTEHLLLFNLQRSFAASSVATDVELRNKDFAAFVFADQEKQVSFLFPTQQPKIVWVKNFTINKSFLLQPTFFSCYIATAIYGESSIEVMALRHFRDSILLPNLIFKHIVKLYYLLSKWLLRAYDNRFLNLSIRCFVCPFAYCYSKSYKKLFLRSKMQANH